MLRNLHTHTWRCRHATGTASDYCGEAVKHGLGELAFTDHVPYPDHLWETNIRMPIEEMDEYFDEVREAQRAYPQLIIHPGFECEYRPELGNWTKEALLEHPGRCEFIILGMHSYVTRRGEWHSSWRIRCNDEMEDYTNFLIRAMETGWFRFVAHPDLFAHAGMVQTPIVLECCKRIVQSAIDLNLPLEINANGIRRGGLVDMSGQRRHPYPWAPFWGIAAAMGAQIIVNSDAHHPENLWDSYVEDAYAFKRFFTGE